MCSNTSFSEAGHFPLSPPGLDLLNDAQWNELSQCAGFSNRERDVCRLLFEGNTRREIATKLGIKPRTVRDYMEKIHNKFDVRNRVGVVLRVIQIRDRFDVDNMAQ
jgi:DNA-binding CsgD family transcriptional regulator